MPRTGRGGRRTGRIGAQYSNRSDLQTPRAEYTGQTYGESVKQRERQQVVPTAAPASPLVPPSAPPQSLVPPGSITPLDAPTQRPNEPLTTGLSVGPGAGPEALTLGGPDDASTMLRRLYAAYPSEDLRALLEFNETVPIPGTGMRVNRYAQLDPLQVIDPRFQENLALEQRMQRNYNPGDDIDRGA